MRSRNVDVRSVGRRKLPGWRRMRIGVRLGAMVLVMAVGSGCASAPRTRSFQDIPQYINPGHTVRLTDTAGLVLTGRLQAVSPAALTILAGDTLREVPEDRVARIQRPERQTVRGALIGLGVGVGLGIISARSSRPSGSPLVDAQAGAGEVAAGMLLGTAVGAIVGAFIKVNRTVYAPPVQPALATEGRPSRQARQP